jgi:hypothetical protein
MGLSENNEVVIVVYGVWLHNNIRANKTHVVTNVLFKLHNIIESTGVP